MLFTLALTDAALMSWPDAATPSLPAATWFLGGAVALLAAVCWWNLRRIAAAAGVRLAVTQAALDAAQGRIRNFGNAQGRFVANLAKEIRDPLATTRLNANLLLDNCSEPATALCYAKLVAEDLQHLTNLVDSFLQLASPAAQEDTSHHVPVPFYDVVLEALHRCQPLAKMRGVSVGPMLAEPDNGAAVEVLGDPILLEAMIANMVRNALMASPRGSRVDLRVQLEGDVVTLSVRDHGSALGVVPLDSTVNSYFQLPAPPRQTADSSLGLALARRVAEHHLGTISVRGVAEGGCESAVQMPRWRPEAPPAKAKTLLSSMPAG